MSEDKNSRLDLTAQFEAEISEEDAGNFYMAREIKQEILNFGVNQIVLEKLIELLALELENREQMLSVIAAVRHAPVETNSSSIIT